MVSLRFDRIDEFIEDAHYAQHASKIGDGIAQLRDRIASVAKEGGQLHLLPRRFVAEGNLYLYCQKESYRPGQLRSTTCFAWRTERSSSIGTS